MTDLKAENAGYQVGNGESQEESSVYIAELLQGSGSKRTGNTKHRRVVERFLFHTSQV